ncbi:MAG: 30S ribosomal protein S18 [Deltaproteobacteria bacterium]|nr:30S ribosomal protein S18 [Deltaproteobacteria bacterium]
MNMRIRKRACKFCVDSTLDIDYKNKKLLEGYITERSKIVPGRVSSVCHFHQRELTRAIKRARQIAILPYTLHESS